MNFKQYLMIKHSSQKTTKDNKKNKNVDGVELHQDKTTKDDKHMLLAGYSGSGKSTYARKLKSKVNKPHVEIDELYEKEAKKISRKKKFDNKDFDNIDRAKIFKRLIKRLKALKKPSIIEGFQLVEKVPGTNKTLADFVEGDRFVVPTSFSTSADRAANRTLDQIDVSLVNSEKLKLTKDNIKKQYKESYKDMPKKMKEFGGKNVELELKKKDSTTKVANIYHGSPKRLRTLKPKNWHGDPGIPDAIFGTKFRDFALPYAGKKWSDLDITQEVEGKRDGDWKQILTEMRPDAFKDIFKGKAGYLHQLAPDTFKERNTHEHISTKKVKPHTIEKIKDVYKALADAGVEMRDFDAKSKHHGKIVKFRQARMKEMDPDKREQYVNWIKDNAHPTLIKAMFGKTAAHSLITGMSRAGKTTKAKELGKKLNMPVVHLDDIWSKEHDKLKASGKTISDKVLLNKLHQSIKKIKHPSIIEGVQLMFNKGGKQLMDHLDGNKYSLPSYKEKLMDKAFKTGKGKKDFALYAPTTEKRTVLKSEGNPYAWDKKANGDMMQYFSADSDKHVNRIAKDYKAGKIKSLYDIKDRSIRKKVRKIIDK